jgi:hypothetical protein
MNPWELGLALCIGVGLAAACGFRIFVPLLAMAVAARADWLSLGEGFAWIGSTPAIAAFAIATLVEILGYCIPWVDNALDAIVESIHSIFISRSGIVGGISILSLNR